eukprot:Gb_24674 [translate_table: standard]
MAYLSNGRYIHSLPRKPSSYALVQAVETIESLSSVLRVEGPPLRKPSRELHPNTLCRDVSSKDAMGYPGNYLDSNTYASLLQKCVNTNSLKKGKQIHAHILMNGLDQNIYLGTKLVSMYSMCGSLEDGRLVFDKIYKPNVVLWNALIKGYAQKGTCEEALTLYYEMPGAGIQPDNFTFTLVLKVCASLLAVQEGEEIHYHIVRSGLESDVIVGTALLDMYAKCGSVEVARQLFDKLSIRDRVSWNAMIAGYAQNGYADEALKLFHRMQRADEKPDLVTMVSVLSACAHLAALQQGMLIHAYTIKSGFESDVFMGNTLIDMYAKCGNIEIARQIFDEMPKKDVVSWNSMVAGYAQNGYANEALILFCQMQLEDVTPNSVTVLGVISACTHLAGPRQGDCIHSYIIKRGFESNVSVENTLMDMYAKCGSVHIAHYLFEKMPKKTAVSWTAMIAGYAQHGHANEALTLFYQMQLEDVKPELVTMVSVLPACADLAALQQGKCIHACIIKSGNDSDVSVGTALLAMYAKCGIIELARRLFDKMSKRDVVLWSAMITGYGMHGHGEDAILLFYQMQQAGLKPDHITFVGLLSACSHAGLVDEGLQYFDCMSRDYCLVPRVEHYACMVDLLGRAGRLNEAHHLIKKMPLEPDASVWGALLGACRIHSNIELGKHVSAHLLKLDPEKAGNYVLLSNIYAAAGKWDDVAKVRAMLKDRGLKKSPGCSWIEIKNRVHAFFVGDRSHPQSEKIYEILDCLAGKMRDAGYVPDTNFVLHDVE